MGSLAERLNDFMARSPGLLEQLVLIAILSAPVILIHELGHALAAKYFRAARIDMHVGGTGPRRNASIAGIQAELSPLARPWRLDGFVVYDPTGISSFGLAAIALAGPVASIAAGLVFVLLMSSSGGLLNDLLWVATTLSIGGGILSLIPMRLVDTVANGRPSFETDGLVALRALGYSPAPRSTDSDRHFGLAIGWLMVFGGTALAVWLKNAPPVEHETIAFLIPLALVAGGVWTIARP